MVIQILFILNHIYWIEKLKIKIKIYYSQYILIIIMKI